jgi:putative DNA methylase
VSTEIDSAPSYKRKLIEVALPLEDINREAAREKSIRHGHPSTLHLWWARRPLAAARAVLFGQLVDDPSAHPDRFPTPEAQQAERERLFAIIRELVKWENSNNEEVLGAARKEIRDSCDDHPPPILDPFAGGGTIPLEAQRLGLEAHASDLNPVAVLINKALIEIPPKWARKPPVHPDAKSQLRWRGAEGLAEDIRCYGKWIRDEAERRIGHLYPKAKLDDGSSTTAIGWLWTRTTTCPNPACGVSMPLTTTYWLCNKKNKTVWLKPTYNGRSIQLKIHKGGLGPPPSPKHANGAIFECAACGAVTSDQYVKSQGKNGKLGLRLLAIIAEGKGGKFYLDASDEQQTLGNVPKPTDAPDEPLPDNPRWFSPPAYGLNSYDQLYTNRQLTALCTISTLLATATGKIAENAISSGLSEDDALAYGHAICTYLAFSLDKLADLSSTLCSWINTVEKVRNTFSRQAIAMIWDFLEINPFSNGVGNFLNHVERVATCIERTPSCGPATSIQANAAYLSGIGVIATDPPYYDNIGYADLSDFFYVWLRRSLRNIEPNLFRTVLTPKNEEMIADPYRFGSGEAEIHFESGLREAFERFSSIQVRPMPLSLFYAFRQAESKGSGGAASTGWEKMLEGLLSAGFEVTATWPMRTERTARSVGIGTNALASSIVLACRLRSDDAGATDRRGFLTVLRTELPARLKELQQGNIAPVDLAQAAIGPGMAVFSRHRQITEPDGSAMRVRTALQLINQVLDEVLSEQEGDFETDSRWCVKWFEQMEWTAGEYGHAETLATALNTAVLGLERAGVLRARAGKVQLLRTSELPEGYDPAKDARPTMWEAVLHLSRRLEKDGPESAGLLMRQLQSVMDLNGVKELAYLLYSICDRKGRQESALVFNNLVTSWPEISDAAQNAPETDQYQAAMDFTDE